MSKTLVVTDIFRASYSRQYTAPVAFDQASFHTVVRSHDLAATSGSTFVFEQERAAELVPQVLDGTSVAYHQDQDGNISLRLVVADGLGGHKETAEDVAIASIVEQSCAVALANVADITDENKAEWITKFRQNPNISRDKRSQPDTALSAIAIRSTPSGFVYSAFGIGDTMIVGFNPKTKKVETLVPGRQIGKLMKTPPGLFNVNTNEIAITNNKSLAALGDDFLIFGLSDGVYEGLSNEAYDESSQITTFTIDPISFADIFSALSPHAAAEDYVAALGRFAVKKVNDDRELLPKVKAARMAVEQRRERLNDAAFLAAIRQELTSQIPAEKLQLLTDADLIRLASNKAGDDCTIAVARVSISALKNAQRYFAYTPFERLVAVLPMWLKISLGILIPPFGFFLITQVGVAQTRANLAEWKPWQRGVLAALGTVLILLCLAAAIAGGTALFTGVGILPALPLFAFIKLSLTPAIALLVGGLIGGVTSTLWGTLLDPLGVWYDFKGQNDYSLMLQQDNPVLAPPPASSTAALSSAAPPLANSVPGPQGTDASHAELFRPTGSSATASALAVPNSSPTTAPM